MNAVWRLRYEDVTGVPMPGWFVGRSGLSNWRCWDSWLPLPPAFDRRKTPKHLRR